MTPRFTPLAGEISRLALLAWLSFPLEAGASGKRDDWKSVRCESAAELDRKIVYCSDNEKARLSAQNCLNAIEAAWKTAALRYPVHAFARDSGQSGDISGSRAGMEYALSQLSALVRLTKLGADRVAGYPRVMVEAAGISGFAESLPCYRSVFEELQRSVTRLDHLAAEGLRTISEGRRLRQGLQLAAARMEGGGEGKPQDAYEHADASRARRAPATPLPVHTTRHASDITGLRPER